MVDQSLKTRLRLLNELDRTCSFLHGPNDKTMFDNALVEYLAASFPVPLKRLGPYPTKNRFVFAEDEPIEVIGECLLSFSPGKSFLPHPDDTITVSNKTRQKLAPRRLIMTDYHAERVDVVSFKIDGRPFFAEPFPGALASVLIGGLDLPWPQVVKKGTPIEFGLKNKCCHSLDQFCFNLKCDVLREDMEEDDQ